MTKLNFDRSLRRWKDNNKMILKETISYIFINLYNFDYFSGGTVSSRWNGKIAGWNSVQGMYVWACCAVLCREILIPIQGILLKCLKMIHNFRNRFRIGVGPIGRAVRHTYCLLPLEHWDRGFESHSRHR
jgi:hypothetical protein